MKKVLAILLALTLCVGMISGCTKIAKDDPAAKGAELEVYMGTKILNLDPATSYTDENAVQILTLIFEGLTKLDENGKLQKALAKKIEITEDPKTEALRLDTLERRLRCSGERRDLRLEAYPRARFQQHCCLYALLHQGRSRCEER